MKKAVFVLLSIIMMLSFFGCGTAMEKRMDNVSELRDEVLVGGDEKITVALNSGFRENPFVIDGSTALERTDFSVITVEGDFSGEEELCYTLYMGEKTYEGKLLKHPFKNSYSVEIAVRSQNRASITISGTNFANNYELNSVKTEETISAKEAFEIAEERLKRSIKSITTEGKLNAEIYLRLLKNPISAEEGYYWYVAYAPEKYVVYAVLIHSQTREITAVRE